MSKGPAYVCMKVYDTGFPVSTVFRGNLVMVGVKDRRCRCDLECSEVRRLM